ncbi:MAG: hypothetical protein AB7V27_17315 [Candidatus Binatia bacterium]
MRRLTSFGFLILTALAAGSCGEAGSRSAETAVSGTSGAGVAVNGRVASPGTKGPLLVFAFAGGEGELSDREVAALTTVDPHGAFALVTAPSDSLTLAFLADGANDGVIDGGDPIAVLEAPELAGLRAGDVVVITDVALNFTNHQASATAIEVRHASGTPVATHTPTPAPE